MPALLDAIGSRFGAGVTPRELMRLAGAGAIAPATPGWFSVEKSPLGVKLFAEAASETARSWWIRVEFEENKTPALAQVQRVLGSYRKLPAGEHTWVMFEGYGEGRVVASAMVALDRDEPASRVLKVQFQAPPPTDKAPR